MRHCAGLFLPIFLCFSALAPLKAQCTLSCNSGMQVSLDQNGTALITPLMIAPNSGNSCPGPLTVTLYNSVGQTLANPLSCAQIGQTVTARVRHTASGNFCTGTLEVIDALSPVLSNCGDKYVFCNDDPSPAAVGMPDGTDNCTTSNQLNFSHFDTETQLGCGTMQNGVPVLRRIDRQWTVSDENGNSSTCLQKVWIRHITFADIIFPPNRDNIASPALSCGQDPDDLDLTGQPSVDGVPVGASPDCEMVVSYSDQKINFCAPAGFTLLRNWTMIDFCTGALNNRTQIIKVEDKQAPVLSAPADVTIGTDGFYCTGSITLPQAQYSDNCSSVTCTPSWEYGNGYGPFSGIVEGEHMVTYTATDACGNSSTATMKVTVVDSSPPQAICVSDLQVSLTNNGIAYINAATINQGSYDNCTPVFLAISRDEDVYTQQLQVTCADQGDPIPVTLRVTDAGGLENFCQTQVTVRDFLKPQLQCPANVTLTCLQNYQDLALTGQALATDNCSLQGVNHQDVINLQPCNNGTVTRIWTAIDSAGNTKTCNQLITINLVNTTAVTFPPDKLVPSCGSPEDILPQSTGQPLITGQSCSPLSVNYTDEVFDIAPPACFRIFRSWKVIDHCIYNPNGGTAGIWEHLQIIDVYDHTPPALSLPADVTVATDPNSCTAQVNLPDVIATDCSNQITLSNDSPYSGAGNTNNASGAYPPGEHLVTFTALDGCGNSIQQTLKITVVDATPPLAVCYAGVSANLDSSGLVLLNPQQFDGGCTDFCSPLGNLSFSLQPQSFDCLHIGPQTVVLTVSDEAGNSAACTAQVLIKDDQYHCGGGPVHLVDGTIRTETGAPVRNIPVTISGDGFSETTSTDSLGRYGFDDIPAGVNYILEASNNANRLNGVTTYDVVLISKHILGIQPFDTPYKMLAGDANRSGSVTTFDMVQLRKLILSILDSLPTNNSWRFVDSSYVFPQPQNPFAAPVPEQILFTPLNGDQHGQNFTGIKVGDVNNSNDPAQARDLRDTLFMQLEDRTFKAGETFKVPVYMNQWASLEGMQMEIDIDPQTAVIEYVTPEEPGLLNDTHLALANGHSLRVSWDHAAPGNTVTNNIPFQLNITALRPGRLSRALRVAYHDLPAEAYPAGEETKALALRYRNADQVEALPELTLFPNPGAGAFSVKNPFGIEDCTLIINDLQGKTILKREGILPSQIDCFIDLPGVYVVNLQTQEKALHGRLTVVK